MFANAAPEGHQSITTRWRFSTVQQFVIFLPQGKQIAARSSLLTFMSRQWGTATSSKCTLTPAEAQLKGPQCSCTHGALHLCICYSWLCCKGSPSRLPESPERLELVQNKGKKKIQPLKAHKLHLFKIHFCKHINKDTIFHFISIWIAFFFSFVKSGLL